VADYCSKLAIHTPVDEKAEALVTKPVQPVRVVASGLLAQSTLCSSDKQTRRHKQFGTAGEASRGRKHHNQSEIYNSKFKIQNPQSKTQNPNSPKDPLQNQEKGG
jgi:hypothetical protein